MHNQAQVKTFVTIDLTFTVHWNPFHEFVLTIVVYVFFRRVLDMWATHESADFQKLSADFQQKQLGFSATRQKNLALSHVSNKPNTRLVFNFPLPFA